MNISPEVDYSLAFDIVYRPLGGRWERDPKTALFQSDFLAYVESMPAAMVSVAESVWSEVPDSKRGIVPKMHFGLIDGQSFNCYATRFNQNYFVALGAMVPVALLEAAAFFFAQPGFYPQIGDPENGPLITLDGVEALPLFQLAQNRFSPRTRKGLADRESATLGKGVEAVRNASRQRDKKSGKPLSANDYFGQFDTLLDMLMPACVIRREHCRYLAAVLCHFFWFHEIAHVTQGHLRSLQEGHGGSLTLYEFPKGDGMAGAADSVLRLDDITTLAMEFDADVEAILMTIGIIMLDIDIESDEFPYVDKYERVGLFVLFLTIVFQILANEEAEHTSAGKTHPPASIRLANMVNYLAHITSADEKITDAIHIGLLAAKKLATAPHYRFLGGILDGADSYVDEWFKVEQHRAKLINSYDTYRYENLRPMVAKFLDEVNYRDKMQLGPEPDWWVKDS